MTIHVVIPDDYQFATQKLDFLHSNNKFHCAALGDLSRDPMADEKLSSAEALILIRERTVIDEAFLKRTPHLKLISQTGKLAGNLDIDACTRAGVALVEGCGSPVAPAELTWLLIMASRRKFVSSVNAMAEGHWQTEIGSAVHNQVIGILGYGKIGKRLASYAAVFGMQVQVWGSLRAQEEARADGWTVPESRERFFATSDVLTVHQRLVGATQGNITSADLALMKTDALFVNTSRAELVYDGALQNALTQGHPGFAALDVYEDEPLYNTRHPYLQMPNVLCTPHLGYVENASYALYFRTAFDNVVRYFSGDRSHVINF
ncbi:MULTISPECIES: D-2-hydroxyacid dehydrogenase family protein [unclassified Pantoea]|uniref:D-2-hydroxyacid dehydrogenase family protein n=1 Tax=unclassified Pantoea TaxID=2630326 RepID=UPI0024774018|nr:MULTISPECIES: D-2-hydroxyacid dehydrogenase family protein [unclassified Pantoea]GME41926.1 D-2-hydroxyacid dehydrogenase family protein [Pantoea sp. QMID1]GME42119.1 D-2-hydroxyacid dehydrogenase family protein [Pantoea sp. QMID3]GME57207.1 D-2-hydroxyacid dehydrogenase family protein [Pantoea sp. QMID4]GME58565.1 D-2-hydroxyacid dehydrogenase family protein [Pantoea sp. QMID2]